MAGVVSVTRFTCRRCGQYEEVDYGSQPEGWGAVTSTRPPLATFEGSREILCKGCLFLVHQTIVGTEDQIGVDHRARSAVHP
jgi:hypothetical protein